MNKHLVPAIFIGLALAGAAALVINSGKLGNVGSQALSGDSIAWDVGYTNELNPQLEATAKQEIDSGGHVNIIATCDSNNDASSITLAFDYYSKDDTGDGNKSAYDTEGSGNFEHVPVLYSIDGGESQKANSQTNYGNEARVVFSYISPNAKVDPITGGAVVLGKLFGGVQDLQPFLRAREVRFQLPLGGGISEIIPVKPQDDAFQDFISQCKIDVKRIDAEVAKQQADEKAAADAKSKEEADAQQRQQEQAAAELQQAQQREEALKQACTTGQGSLRATNTVPLEGAQHGIITTYVFGGQIAQPVADADAVASNKCSIQYTRGNDTFAGQVPLNALQVVDAVPASIPAPEAPASPAPQP